MSSSASKAVNDLIMLHRMRGTATENGPLQDLPTVDGRIKSRRLTNSQGIIWVFPDEMRGLLARIRSLQPTDFQIHSTPKIDDNGDLVHAEGIVPVGYLGGRRTDHPVTLRTRIHPETGEELHGIHMPRLAVVGLGSSRRAIRTPLHAEMRDFIDSLGSDHHPDGVELGPSEVRHVWGLITDHREDVGPGHTHKVTRNADNQPFTTREWRLGKMPSALGSTPVVLRAFWNPGKSKPHAMTIISGLHANPTRTSRLEQSAPATAPASSRTADAPASAPSVPGRTTPRPAGSDAPAGAPAGAPSVPGRTPRQVSGADQAAGREPRPPSSRELARSFAKAKISRREFGDRARRIIQGALASETARNVSRIATTASNDPTTPLTAERAIHTADTLAQQLKPESMGRSMAFPFAIWPQQSLSKGEKPWEKPEAKDKANIAKNKKKWGRSRAAATRKFGEKNSYVKNMWAARHYKKHGGKWEKP